MKRVGNEDAFWDLFFKMDHDIICSTGVVEVMTDLAHPGGWYSAEGSK